MTPELQRQNRKTALTVLAVVVFMAGLAFASVPLYDLFCRVTGFGGTTQVADSLPERIATERTITVRFNADTAPSLRWTFAPEQRAIDVHPGQKGLVAYKARNYTGQPLAGTAVYNVTPPKAGKYFHKIQCFCFDEQILTSGEEMTMPVMFFIHPDIMDDRDMDEVKTITLSYTFFKTETAALEQALEDFYNQDAPAVSHGPAPDIITDSAI